MSIRIAHCSDTHDRPSIVRAVAGVQPDIILLTGDCINNRGRINGEGIIPSREVRYQESWARKQAKKWAADFAGRPVITIRGNHCFISQARWLRHYGCTVYEITDDNPLVELFGIRFAGFRQVGWIAGEWPGEEHDLQPFVDKAFDCNPDVLITHAPPAGILAGPGNYGVSSLTTALTWRDHNITDHFFGHAHEDGGESMTEMGINFYNGAGHMKVHTIR